MRYERKTHCLIMSVKLAKNNVIKIRDAFRSKIIHQLRIILGPHRRVKNNTIIIFRNDSR